MKFLNSDVWTDTVLIPSILNSLLLWWNITLKVKWIISSLTKTKYSCNLKYDIMIIWRGIICSVVGKQYCFRSSDQRCSVKTFFIAVSQNSQENTCARVSFLIKLQALRNFSQNTSDGCFSNSFSSKGEDNLVIVVVGSLTAWIGVVTINWLAQAKFSF